MKLGFRIEVEAMISKIILSALALLSVAAVSVANAQESKRLPRIGYLSLGSAPAEPEAAFRQQLRELGWLEGRNLTIDYRWAANDIGRLTVQAEELVRLPVDVLVVSSTPVVQAAKKATTSIPIIMMGAADPVASGFVTSLARPGGNITGLSLQSPELAGKRLELLKEIVPKLNRVAFLAHGGDPAHKFFINEARDAAERLGIRIQPVVIEGPAEIEVAFSSIVRDRSGAAVIQPLLTGSALGQGRNVAEHALKNRLPTISDGIRFPEAGGLMSYGSNRLDHFRRGATYVDKILKGAKPADLPVEQPTKFDFIINLKTAKQISLTIPPNVLARADRVIR